MYYDENTRIRYGRNTKGQKNKCLMTYRDPDCNVLFYGISRCNKKDRWSPGFAKELADERMHMAMWHNEENSNFESWVSNNQMYGYIHYKNVKELLDFFNSMP
jgi:hypothetical protein